MDSPEEPLTTVLGGSSSLNPLAPHDLTGKMLGDFLVERLLGQGGMGEVYLARQISLDRSVALKVLRPEWASNPTYMARFESEAWAAAKLNHPNIVHIYTLGTLSGVRFIAMEYVQGTNLREYLLKRGIPELPLALAIMRQTCLAIGAAGEAGLIHRDIKPENLLLTRKGQVKVADFGLAKLAESDRLHLTATGMTLGTPMYMSPEQVQSREIDNRSDLYSLGVTYYHMLAGKPPFQAETAIALALKHVRDQPISLAVHRPNLPPVLVNLVMRLLEKDPNDRYQSAGEVLKDLAKVKEAIQAGVSGIATINESPLLAAAVVPTLLSAPPASKPRLPRPEMRWSPGIRTFVTLGIVGLAVGAGLGWMARTGDLGGANRPANSSPPALWMADWQTIPKQATAAAQYRFAQTRVPSSQRAEAWLATPGRFPNEPDWAWSSYLQLARHYLREGDRVALETLSKELKAGETKSGSAREKWLSLARFMHAGAIAIEGESGEVVATFGTYSNTAAMDPALAAFCLEVIWQAMRHPPRKESDAQAFIQIRNQLLVPLKISPMLYDLSKPKPKSSS